MQVTRALRVMILTVFFLVGSCFTFSPVLAQQQTTLYFVNASPLLFDDTSIDFLGNPELDTDIPATSNYTLWPPRLLVREQKIVPSLNSEEWLGWVEMWVLYQFADQLLGYEEFSGEEGDIIQSFFDMYNPFRISQDFQYTGNDTVVIDDNIIFTLYMKSRSRLTHKDEVKVGISKSMLLFSTELANATATIPVSIIPGIIKPVTVELSPNDEPIELESNDIITLFVEIMPSSYALGRILKKLSERGFEEKVINVMDTFATFLSNRNIEKLHNLGVTLKDFINISDMFSEEGVNLSLMDVAELTDGIRCSQFAFGSSKYPSHVILPLEIKPEDSENKVTYYLHNDDTMDAQQPTSEEPEERKITGEKLRWTGDGPSRNKILKEATLSLFLDYRNLLKIRPLTVGVDLLQDDTLIKSASQELSRSTLLGMLKGELEPLSFSFDNLDNYELSYDKDVHIDVYLDNNSKLGLRKLNVVFDGTTASSKLVLTYDETENIGFTAESQPADKKIIPGGSVHYLVEVTSKKADTISMLSSIESKAGQWDITVIPESFSIGAGETQTAQVYINSTNDKKSAYGNTIDVLIEAAGKTGIARDTLSAEVSRDAKTYSIELLTDIPESTGLKRGETTFINITFLNNNTGASDDTDSYDIQVISEEGFDLEYPSTISSVPLGTSRVLSIEVMVDDDANSTSDDLEVTITSQGDDSISLSFTIPVEVISGNIFERIMDWFSDLAATIGLTDIFGDDAVFILLIILLVIIFFILIIIALILTSKRVSVDCLEPIQEIEEDEEALFDVIITNPSKKPRTYTIRIRDDQNFHWKKTIEPDKILVEPRQSQTASITLSPPDEVPAGDWVQVTIDVHVEGSSKHQSISLMVMLAGGSPDLQVQEVTHYPRTFSINQKVVTTCKVKNLSATVAENVSVFLYINGKQKNKVQGITIPGRGYAELDLPWIAEDSENHLHITVIKNP